MDRSHSLRIVDMDLNPGLPLLRMNKSYQDTWNFDLLVGTNQDHHDTSQDFCDDLVKQGTRSALHTVKAPVSMGETESLFILSSPAWPEQMCST